MTERASHGSIALERLVVRRSSRKIAAKGAVAAIQPAEPLVATLYQVLEEEHHFVAVPFRPILADRLASYSVRIK
jgi:hypothetical protein